MIRKSGTETYGEYIGCDVGMELCVSIFYRQITLIMAVVSCRCAASPHALAIALRGDAAVFFEQTAEIGRVAKAELVGDFRDAAAIKFEE